MTNQRAAVEALVAEILTGKRDLVETFLVFAATQRAEEAAKWHARFQHEIDAARREIAALKAEVARREGPG